MDVKRFEADLAKLAKRAEEGEEIELKTKLESVKNSLVELYKQNIVKINHSALELLCAKNLIKLGYEVEVEHRLTESLVCDVYGTKGDGSLIVEIETGFVPPAHALDPATYSNARIASKIARYSSFAQKFALGTTPTNILNIPVVYQEPPRYRNVEDAMKVKALCDIYYTKPPVALNEIVYARLHSVYIIDVDSARVSEVAPDLYIQSALSFREKAG